jgi:hypothetical protein
VFHHCPKPSTIYIPESGEKLAMNTTAIAATGYQTLALDQMHESSTNPRRTFEPLKLSELAESLRTHGLIQPVTVRPHNGGFEIVAGARRFRAARIAQLAEVPVRILDVTDGETVDTLRGDDPIFMLMSSDTKKPKITVKKAPRWHHIGK